MPPPAEGFAARFVVGPALRTQPDCRLVTLVREGYENAFEEIVRRYGRPLTRYAGAIVGNRAEDVTQDAFSKALLALRRNEKEIALRPWLFRIVRNTALNDLRDRPPAAAALAEAIANGDDPAEELARREELADLIERLGSLPDAQRAAIVMRELEGLSHEEIAKALGLSGGAARQAIFRARQTLRDGLGMLLPLPLLKGLLAGTAVPPVEAAAGTAGVGGGVAGTGVALKAVTATVLVAGAVGAGVTIDHGRRGPHHGGGTTPRAQHVVDDQVPASSVPADAQSSGASGQDDPDGRGESEPGADHGDHRGQGDDHSPSSGSGPLGSDRRSSDSGSSEPHLEAHDGRGSGGDGSSGPSSDSSPGGPGGSSGSGRDGSGSGGGPDGGSSSNSAPGGGSSSPAEATVTETSSSGDSKSSGGSGGGSGSGSSSGSSPDESGDSSDSHGGSGLSIQTEPQS